MSASTPTRRGDSLVSATRPLTRQLEEIVETWAKSHHDLVMLAAEFADSPSSPELVNDVGLKGSYQTMSARWRELRAPASNSPSEQVRQNL